MVEMLDGIKTVMKKGKSSFMLRCLDAEHNHIKESYSTQKQVNINHNGLSDQVLQKTSFDFRQHRHLCLKRLLLIHFFYFLSNAAAVDVGQQPDNSLFF